MTAPEVSGNAARYTHLDDPALADALERDDQAETAGMHADQRETCHGCQTALADDPHAHDPHSGRRITVEQYDVDQAETFADRGIPVPAGLPTREQLDSVHEQYLNLGCTEEQARAFEYLDARRDLVDERHAAYEAGDTAEVEHVDRQHALLDRNFLDWVNRNADRDERERGER